MDQRRTNQDGVRDPRHTYPGEHLGQEARQGPPPEQQTGTGVDQDGELPDGDDIVPL